MKLEDFESLTFIEFRVESHIGHQLMDFFQHVTLGFNLLVFVPDLNEVVFLSWRYREATNVIAGG